MATMASCSAAGTSARMPRKLNLQGGVGYTAGMGARRRQVDAHICGVWASIVESHTLCTSFPCRYASHNPARSRHPAAPVFPQQRVPELVGREGEPLEQLALGQRVQDVVGVPAGQGDEERTCCNQCIEQLADLLRLAVRLQRTPKPPTATQVQPENQPADQAPIPPWAHPTAAVRLRLPVHRIREEPSAAMGGRSTAMSDEQPHRRQ